MLLAQQTDLTERRVRYWFGARRSKLRCRRKGGEVYVNEQTGDDNNSTMNVYIPVIQN